MTLPNFLCVGTQKGGTTSLHNILKGHPDVYLPRVKETKFFAFDDLFQKGMKFYEKEYFSGWRGQRAVGEIDPLYMFLESVPQRIFDNLGKATKLIFMLRHPVDRAYSHYWMSVRRGYEKRSFEDAMKSIMPQENDSLFNKMHYSYISRGFYSSQIERFSRLFSKENIRVVVFEDDFLKQRKETIAGLLDFLGVSPIDLDIDIKSNPASMPRSIFVRDLMYKPNIFTKYGKYLLPSKYLREKVRWILEEVNQVEYKPPKLTRDLKTALMKKYFIEDTLKLEEIIGRKLDVWY